MGEASALAATADAAVEGDAEGAPAAAVEGDAEGAPAVADDARRVSFRAAVGDAISAANSAIMQARIPISGQGRVRDSFTELQSKLAEIADMLVDAERKAIASAHEQALATQKVELEQQHMASVEAKVSELGKERDTQAAEDRAKLMAAEAQLKSTSKQHAELTKQHDVLKIASQQEASEFEKHMAAAMTVCTLKTKDAVTGQVSKAKTHGAKLRVLTVAYEEAVFEISGAKREASAKKENIVLERQKGETEKAKAQAVALKLELDQKHENFIAAAAEAKAAQQELKHRNTELHGEILALKEQVLSYCLTQHGDRTVYCCVFSRPCAYGSPASSLLLLAV